MKEDTNDLCDKAEMLFNQEKFDEIIALLTDEELEIQKDVELYLLRGNTWNKKKNYDKAIIDYNKAIEINPKNADLYIWRGNTWYTKKDYDEAIINYDKAIEINSIYELAFYNKGAVWVAKKEYNNAIADYTKAIEVNPNFADAYVSRGNIKRVFNGDYDGAIADYTEAIKINQINLDNENAYYYRGLAYYKKALNKTSIDLPKSKQDLEKYLELTTEENNNNGAKYAKLYIEELKEVIEDPNLWSIKQLVYSIKNKLLIRKENCITHYTGLSVLKDLIFDDSRFRISEGNFMNDPSEGKEFFNFLKYVPDTLRKDSPSPKISPKPFIGSFVTDDKCNNLNMWRFYGKEKGEEAKGCAITLRKQEFLDDIKDSLLNEKNKEARLDDESDINFYRVVYVVHNNRNTKFYIPDSDKSAELESLMKELKKKVEPYKKKGNSRTFLKENLNSIAFLFKNDAYKNEDEVRLVMNGIEFPKKYDMGLSSPRVYIELVSIKDTVSQIILGPKVDKISEWKSAFHYCYEKRAPDIKFSHLPYK